MNQTQSDADDEKVNANAGTNAERPANRDSNNNNMANDYDSDESKDEAVISPSSNTIDIVELSFS